jgi:two-component system, OmpR family, KDP operon response regulator KdpE
MIKVLVVDDEPQLLRALRINLTARRYEVVTAVDGTSALAIAARTMPDLVVLDLGLPDLDGAEVIRGLRGWSEVPIIVLSGRADSSDKVDALDAGADDYLTKPFSMEELLARLRVALRHADRNAPRPAMHQIGDYEVDVSAHTVTRTDEAPDVPESVHLTPTEWGIVEVLLRNSGRLVATKQILTEVWGHGYENDTALLRFHLTKLRRKLEREPSRPVHLLTEPGMGYRFQP